MWLRRLIVILLLLNAVGIVTAQDCPAGVDDTLDIITQLCETAERNEACYGNLAVLIEPRNTDIDYTFENPGDRMAVPDIARLELLPATEQSSDWGIVLLQVQTDLENTMPGQQVTIALFGEVLFENTTDVEADHLDAFYFSSGIGTPVCEQAPDGILVQTPEGDFDITMTINEVIIEPGSTFFLQAAPGDQMTVTVLEGEITLTVEDETLSVAAGEHAAIPLDADGTAAGPPQSYTPPDDYADLLAALPLALLPREITPPSGSGTDMSSSPLPGMWMETWATIGEVDCADGRPGFIYSDGIVTLSSTDDDQSLLMELAGGSTTTLTRQGDSQTYTGSFDFGWAVQTWTLTFESTTRATGTHRAVRSDIENCENEQSITWTYEGETCRTVATGNVNVRENPGTGYAIVGTTTAGESYNITAQTIGVDGATWWWVDEIGGWVSASVFQVTCDNVPAYDWETETYE